MWPDLQETADLVTFIEKILDGKLHFLCSVKYKGSLCKITDFNKRFKKEALQILTKLRETNGFH